MDCYPALGWTVSLPHLHSSPLKRGHITQLETGYCTTPFLGKGPAIPQFTPRCEEDLTIWLGATDLSVSLSLCLSLSLSVGHWVIQAYPLGKGRPVHGHSLYLSLLLSHSFSYIRISHDSIISHEYLVSLLFHIIKELRL